MSPFLDEKIMPSTDTAGKYAEAVCNPDGSNIFGGTVASTLYKMQVLNDSDATYTYQYVCEALSGSLVTAPVWRIKKVTTTIIGGDISVLWADGNTNFDNVATDLATVSAFSYN